jgi:peptidoglycan/LPS O-acetylase OafA/YrhL
MKDMHRARRNLDALTGLRAIAALWVIAFHYRGGPFRPLGANHVLPVLGYGYLGVDLFFILSGFVIWHVHGPEFARPRPRTFARFMCLRAARLYPVYLFTLCLIGLLVWLAPQIGDPPLNPAYYTGRLFLLHLALVQSWGFTHILSWNYPSWSVSAEWFCYLLFPFAAPLALRLGKRSTAAAALILLAAVSVTYLTAFNESLNQSVGAMTLLRAAPEFLLGCLLRQLAGEKAIGTWPWLTITTAAAGIWAASFFSLLPVGLLAIPLFATLILAGSQPGNLVARALGVRPLVAIGAASYSLYLMQAPVQKGARVLKQYLSPSHPMQSLGVVSAYLLLLACGTALVHVFIENPSRRWLRARVNTLFQRQPLPPAPAIDVPLLEGNPAAE